MSVGPKVRKNNVTSLAAEISDLRNTPTYLVFDEMMETLQCLFQGEAAAADVWTLLSKPRNFAVFQGF